MQKLCVLIVFFFVVNSKLSSCRFFCIGEAKKFRLGFGILVSI